MSGRLFGILRHHVDYTVPPSSNDSGDGVPDLGFEACAPAVIITRDEGNVGIGITDPGSKLHLFDTEVGNSSTLTLKEILPALEVQMMGVHEFKVRETWASRIQARIM